MEFKIVEKSLFARIARWVLKSRNVAMVLGKTIHLSGVSKNDFMNDSGWVAHELCHIRQFREHGYLRFLWLYLVESWRVGYYNNKYEVEARMEGMKHQKHMNTSQRVQNAIKPFEAPVPADKKDTV